MEPNPKQIPEELLPTIGRLLRQARNSRKLTPAQAADRIGITIGELRGLEEGSIPATTDYILSLVSYYHGARAGVIEDLFYRLLDEKLRCQYLMKKRKHLSLIGEDPKPWEKIRHARVIQSL